MALFRSICSMFVAAVAMSASLHAQVMTVASNGSTGLDVRLSTDSYNYTLFRGEPSLWGRLGTDGYVEYTVNAAPGRYAVQIYYANGSATSGAVTTVVNGSQQGSIPIAQTGSWGRFQLSAQGTVELPAGQSRLRLAATQPPQPYNLGGLILTPVSLLTANLSGAGNGNNPLLGSSFFVNPYSAAAKNSWLGCWSGVCISKIASQPQGVWFGDWNSNPAADVSVVMASAAKTGTVPILVAYNLPNRDCGGYSSGGAANTYAYQSWIQSFSSGIGNGKAVVILEPDALTQYNTRGCLNDTQKNERLSLLQYAISQFQQHAPNASVYFDAGPPNGINPALMAETLLYAGVSRATGFAVNVSNYESTQDSTAYGETISPLVGGKHFVIDTSRNGRGPSWDHQFCNPPNRGLGLPSQAISGGLVDAYLWVQNPGTSDGTCNGQPGAGTFSNFLAWTLLTNSVF